ncbi:MAG TPA: CRISPR system precrRNA processing endoribonuclease RAMP protein Cas6 [Bryobacteraceae bacterium]|nr:CRISPR system precrRNA processing endoribonuclease RAMP protein Cas6 [Bryobacteraceae bacterium]
MMTAQSAERWFEFYRLRFTYRAAHRIVFPPDKPGNVLRGGFGLVLRGLACDEACRDCGTCPDRATCPYTRLFEPLPDTPGPSGYSERARPFVFRAAHLNARRIAPGESFWFDFHLFETREAPLDILRMTFAQLGREGLGASRGRAELASMEHVDAEGRPQSNGAPLRLSLAPEPRPVRRLHVDFITPTELKSRDVPVGEPRFSVLLARARDRVSRLRALSDAAPLDIDYRALGERARAVAMTGCELRHIEVARRSSRTGQRHPLGGFIGSAEYEGELAEFLPWLRAAQFTGVGRQTGWGKGQIQVSERD